MPSTVSSQFNVINVRDKYKASWIYINNLFKITTICTSVPGDVTYIYSNRGPLTQIGMISQWTEPKSRKL